MSKKEKGEQMDDGTVQHGSNDEACLEEFKKALHGSSGLVVSEDDEYLLRFLRTKAFEIPPAVLAYKRTTVWREKHAEFLRIPFSDCLPCFEQKLFKVLRVKDETGATIIHGKLDNWDPSKARMETVMKCYFFLVEEINKSAANQVNGIVSIADMENVSTPRHLEYATNLTMKNLRLLIGYVSGGHPMKFKALHNLATPLIIRTIYAAVKYLIKEKMRNRIHLHYDGHPVLLNYMGKDVLPESLGGNIPDDVAEDKELMKSMFQRYNVAYNDN